MAHPTLVKRGEPLAAAILGAIVLSSAYGASDEWHQLFTPGRNSDIHDWFADTLGGVVGTVGYELSEKLRRSVGGETSRLV